MANRRRRRGGRSIPRVRLVNRRHRRHHYRRNPVLAGFNTSKLTPILFASVGYMGTHAIEYFLTAPGVDAAGNPTAPLIPTTVTGSTLGKYAVRIGSAIAATYLAKMFMRAKEQDVMIGAGTYVAVSIVKDFAPTSISPYLAAYAPPVGMGRMAAYTTPARLNGMRGMNGNLMAFAASGGRADRGR